MRKLWICVILVMLVSEIWIDWNSAFTWGEEIAIKLATDAQPRPRFIIMPKNTSALVGEKVIMDCFMQNQLGEVQWVKDGWGLGNLSAYGNYKWPNYESYTPEDYSLHIAKVTLEDAGEFECQASPGPDGSGVGALRSPKAVLTVAVKTKDDENAVKRNSGGSSIHSKFLSIAVGVGLGFGGFVM